MASETYNATSINDRLIVGAGLVGQDELDYLKAQGVTHVVNCAAELNDLSLCQADGTGYLAIAWKDDGTVKPVSDFIAALSFAIGALSDQLGRGKLARFYVHCAAGCNRGPMMASFLLAALSGNPADRCYADIKSLRPQVSAFDQGNYRNSVLAALEAVSTPMPHSEISASDPAPVSAPPTLAPAPIPTPPANGGGAGNNGSSNGKSSGGVDSGSGSSKKSDSAAPMSLSIGDEAAAETH